MPVMKTLMGYEIYDAAARGYITPVVTEGDGSAYTATVEGIDALSVGVSFIMVPHVTSTTQVPTLNVNGLGAKGIYQRLSSTTSVAVNLNSDNWIGANQPIRVMYNGADWIVDFTAPDADNLSGVVSIANGGTGGGTVAEARNNLGLGNTDGALPIENGGTNATTHVEALNNLGITWGTDEAPATGTPNTIYIQIN